MLHNALHTGEPLMTPIQYIRAQSPIEEIDYIFLTTLLQKWSAPRNLISRLVKAGHLIRVKKGIYVFGSLYSHRPFSLEVLANKIYGPSYVSAEYALSFWGLIPEGVNEVTSMTTGKNKHFTTPVGRFSYHHLKPLHFSVGVVSVKQADGYSALIATPEKALVDLLMLHKENPSSPEELKRVLFEDLRIYEEGFYKLKIPVFQEILTSRPQSLIKWLIQLICEEKERA